MRQESLEHMMMPSLPSANFVVVHAHFPFRFLQGSFYRPSQTADTYQFLDGAIGGGVAQIVLHFGLRFETAATTDQPLPNSGQAVLDRGHTQGSKLGQQRTFTAFVDPVTMPGGSGQLQDQCTHLFRSRGTASDTSMQARPPHRTPWPGSSIRGVRNHTRVSLGTSAMYHLCNAAVAAKKAGVFP